MKAFGCASTAIAIFVPAAKKQRMPEQQERRSPHCFLSLSHSCLLPLRELGNIQIQCGNRFHIGFIQLEVKNV
jgi:hypothetical protein